MKTLQKKEGKGKEMISFCTLASSSKGNAYIVTNGKTQLLLEAGIPIKQLKQKTDYQINKITACLVTHEHQDHAKAIKDLLKLGIDCYMSQGTAQALQVSGHRVHILQAKKQLKIGTWRILPFNVVHDAQEPLGFLLVNQVGEKLLFVTDTHYIPYQFRQLTHLAVECNYDLGMLEHNLATGKVHLEVAKRLLKNHLSLRNLLIWLRSINLDTVQEIHLLHLSDNNSDERLFKQEIGRVYNGKVIIH